MSRSSLLPAILLAVVCAPLCSAAHAEKVLRSVDIAQEGACVQTHIRLVMPVRAIVAVPDGVGAEVVIPIEAIGSGAAGGDALEGPPGNVAGLKTVALETDADGSRLRIAFVRPVAYRLVMEAETRHLRIDTSADGRGSCNLASTTSPKPAAAMGDADAAPPAASDASAMTGADSLPGTLPKAGTGSSATLIDNSSVLRGTIDPDTSLRSLQGLETMQVAPASRVWTATGSVSQSYYRDDLSGTSHVVADSRLMTGISLQAKGDNRDWAAEMRLDALQHSGIGMPEFAGKNNLSTAYLDLKHKSSQTVARIGRQTRDDGGIFGRFDGAWLGIEASKRLSLGLAAGSPVYKSDQVPFADDTAFLSARATYALRPSVLFVDLYAIEQHADAAVDRRALGAEIRHEASDLAAYAGADYDIYQNRWSSAYASANWQASERITINGALDYRTTPFLLTSNALSGQNQDKLPSLVRLLGENQVLALAGDRTSDAVTASLGLSYRMSDRWQVTLDGLLMQASGTQASGGANATPGSDADLYVSAYAYGDGMFVPNAAGGLGIFVARSERMTRVGGDVFLRYPLTDRLTLSPRLRASVKPDATGTGVKVTPSLGARYRLDKHWLLESELGVSLENSGRAGETGSSETQAFAGYRYEF